MKHSAVLIIPKSRSAQVGAIQRETLNDRNSANTAPFSLFFGYVADVDVVSENIFKDEPKRRSIDRDTIAQSSKLFQRGREPHLQGEVTELAVGPCAECCSC